jgi:extracellular factor (EF) 3-hydroxypalmitic acid methyl ester biosynthesis protein
MSFGPGWNPPPVVPAATADTVGALDTAQTVQVARQVAEYLVDRLEWARRQTEDWANPDLTDALVESIVGDCLARLADTGCWGEANRAPSGELWRIAEPWLRHGWLQCRARYKPRGYAGDFGLVLRVCQGYVAPHPLGRAFDGYFHRQAAAEAVRARTEQIAAALSAHTLASPAAPYCAVSIGAGPALDIAGALYILPPARRREMQVSLLDLDPAALRYAGRKLAGLLPAGQLHCVRENLFRLAHPAKADVLPAKVDFLSCTGLFDYLPDPAALSLLRLFWNRLSPGGRLLVGNFAPHCPTRAYMEWGGNWYLLYRTAADLDRLAREAGMPDGSFRIGADRTGVDLFLIADR